MAWWKLLFRGRRRNPLEGMTYQVTSTLYSADGKRCAQVLSFGNGETYLLESDWAEGSNFKERHGGRPVGPFTSLEEAERFVVATQWFNDTN